MRVRGITRAFIPGFIALCLGFIVESTGAAAKKIEPSFLIQAEGKTLTYSRSKLLAMKERTTVVVEQDPGYLGKKMTYVAVPLHLLFESLKISESATLLYHCLDGFSAPISQKRLLNHEKSGAIAYLAIEQEGEPWPVLDPSAQVKKTPSPFYLVWMNPEASQISKEEWPFQLTGFEVKKSILETYPDLGPQKGLGENHPVSRGFKQFTKNCFACHTLNHQGEGHMGPDLNIPLNPTEYFKPAALRALIREPKSVRTWEKSLMYGFPKDVISDGELEDLIQYLEQMSSRKVKLAPAQQ